MTGRIGATYRLQLGPDLSFTDVSERVDYLARLGIECLYCSPIAEAVPGSTHGYDVTDPTRLRAELGGDAGFSALGSAAAAAGLAVMIDIVPNHLSTSVDGPWWRDVLRLGEQSEFAEVFDIDWASGGGKVLVPLIDRPIDEAVKSNMVRIDDSEGGEPLVHVGEMTLPITAGTVRDGEDVLEVLAAQPYRLVDWHDRTQRNYRRFFDIDGLVGVRVERTEVFRRTHALVARLVEEGLVNSLRVDHIDGLADPGAYLQQLAELTGGIPVVVEKILTGDERLRSSWPVVGTTGYEVIDDIAGALIDPDGFDRLAGAAEAEGQRPVEVCTTTGRRIAAEGPFAVDIERAARRLGVDGRELAAVTARMPYYRTYLDGGPVHTDDAVALSMASIGEHAEAVAIREACADPDRLEGVLAWQQLTGAVMAKGVEDTAWYRLPGRLALCEVGGDPARPRGDAIERLHRRAASRATGVHGGLVPSTTHDTKHSGDARARLYVLSELAVGFEAALDRFRDLLNRELHASSTLGAEHSGAEHSGAEHSGAEHSGAESSTLGIEIVASESRLLAQTVLSVLPVEAHPEQYDDLCERVSQAMIKSTREAKLHSSWDRPNESYERIITRLVEATCRDGAAAIHESFGPLVSRILSLGATASLASVVMRSALPGIPDCYQGDETWNCALVDPDNRRPVDIGPLAGRLASLVDSSGTYMATPGRMEELRRRWSSGEVKMAVTAGCLAARRIAREALAPHARYLPLDAEGPMQRSVLAWSRLADHAAVEHGAVEHGASAPAVIAVVTRLASLLDAAEDDLPAGKRSYGETRVSVPRELRGVFTDVLSGKTVDASAGSFAVAEALEELPVALLVRSPSS